MSRQGNTWMFEEAMILLIWVICISSDLVEPLFPEVRNRKGTETGLLDPTITGWRSFLLHYFCSPSLFLSLASLVCPQHHHFQPKTLQARCLLLKVMHALWFFSKQLFFTRSPGRRRCWAKHRTFTGQCLSSGWVLVCSWSGAQELCPGQAVFFMMGWILICWGASLP